MEADIRFAIVPASMARTAKPRQFAPLVRSQCSDAADLNSDRTEIRKSAERERGNRERARIERAFCASQH